MCVLSGMVRAVAHASDVFVQCPWAPLLRLVLLMGGLAVAGASTPREYCSLWTMIC